MSRGHVLRGGGHESSDAVPSWHVHIWRIGSEEPGHVHVSLAAATAAVAAVAADAAADPAAGTGENTGALHTH